MKNKKILSSLVMVGLFALTMVSAVWIFIYISGTAGISVNGTSNTDLVFSEDNFVIVSVDGNSANSERMSLKFYNYELHDVKLKVEWVETLTDVEDACFSYLDDANLKIYFDAENTLETEIEVLNGDTIIVPADSFNGLWAEFNSAENSCPLSMESVVTLTQVFE